MEVVAVNTDKAKAMQSAFESYKAGIDDALNYIKNLDQAQYLAGFKGDQVTKIHEYVGEIIEQMHLIDEPLNEFKEGIDAVMKNYEAQSTAEGSRIGGLDTTVDAIEGAGELTGVKPFSAGESGQ